ncbi:MAG TPA: iron ABC transporter permease [Candidatus Salinicoccus merdavium]|nr:iron ABC transporter permease [Candidatus Salinicoccus merdavium]
MRYIVIFTASILVLVSGIFLSLYTGAADITAGNIRAALLNFDALDNTHVIINEIRLPRALAAAITGAGFSVGGAVMQAMTRNPLAEPGLLGINAGALFFLTIAFSFFPHLSYPYLVLLSFAGALFSALIVFAAVFFSKSRMTPMKLILAGVAVTLFFSSLSAALQLYFDVGQDIAFWSAGAIQNIDWQHLLIVTPWFIIGMIMVMALSSNLTAISFDEETAISLGVHMTRTRIIALIAVVILAGLAVSVAGAVAFVGLITPHITRKIAGSDYKMILPLSGVLGAVLVVYSDLAARSLFAPVEIPVAALIALIGVPFFLYLAGRPRHEI